ncbi:MAG: hypothetical protein K6A70_11265 [Erysipelotrichaceae bacterium]|nr:hypothetical protein [Erysipelotrichaceae bacterium]
MKKILLYLVISIFAVNVLYTNVSADEQEFNYTVTLTSDFKFESDYLNDSTGEGGVKVNEAIQQALNSMEPGDSATINFTLKNEYGNPVDWYMLNDTLKPFEKDSRVDESGKRTVDGGNYTYQLLYKNSHGEDVDLYDSTSVGGENSQGLEDATNALDDPNMFKLDTFNSGDTSKLTLHFEIDGETQKNNYQDVLGQLQVRFGAQKDVPEKKEPQHKEEEVKKVEKVIRRSRRTVYTPYTGDTSNLPYFVLAELILANLLIVIVWSYIIYRRRQEAR